MKKKTRQWFRWMIHLLYPERCPFCDCIIYRSIWEEKYKACNICRNEISYIQEPQCKKCGKPITDEREEFCMDCQHKKHSFVQGKALLEYKGNVKESMYRFKYSNRREYGKFYGQEIYVHYEKWLKQCKLDAIIPIPLHKTRKKVRGFNQAEIIAKEIGKNLNVPVISGLLVRMVNTRPQKELSDKERKNNLKKAFKINENKVQLKKILLVDDIYTTGFTMNEATKMLKSVGVDQVYTVSISIGRGY